MKKAFELEGIKEVSNQLNKELDKITIRTSKGLILAAALIRKDMDDTEPKIPIYTGNLRASWFTDPIRAKTGPALLMGFTANYAAYVHEMVDANFKGDPDKVRYTKSGKVTAATKKFTRRPGAGAKFLEAALYRNKDEIINIIRDNAAVK